MGVGGEVTKAGGWMLFLGILYVIGGILGIALPLVAGLSVAWVLGFVLAALGIFQAIAGFQAHSFGPGAAEFQFASRVVPIPDPVVNQPSPLPPLRRVREEDAESVS